MKINVWTFALILASVCAYGQKHTVPNLDSNNTFTGVNSFTQPLSFLFQGTTVGALPPASLNSGRPLWVSDAISAGDCSTGGGSSYVLCISNGTAWVGSGGGGGGGSISGVTAGTGLTGGGVSGTVTLNLSSVLPNGQTATTQTPGDNTDKVATDAFVLANGSSSFAGLTPGANTNATPFRIAPGSAVGGSTSNLSIAGPASDTNTAPVLNVDTGASSVQPSFRVGVQGTDAFKILEIAGNNQQTIAGFCSATQATIGDLARQVICFGSASVTGLRVLASSSSFTGKVIQAETVSLPGSAYKLFSGRAGCETDGTCANGFEVFSVDGAGGVAANTVTTTNLVVSGSCTGCGGGGGSGTVTSVATASPISGGPFSTTGTIACPTCVTSSSPGAGVAHFAGSTQAATSSAVVDADLSGSIAVAHGGTGATTAAGARVNLFPAGSKKGDLLYCSTFAAGACSVWDFIPGNATGSTGWLQELADGSPSFSIPPGSGTVVVAGAGNLTSTALVTGGGTQVVQTPSVTSTLDSSGNLSLAAGGSIGSADTGTPKLTFSTNLITANQKITGTIFNASTGFAISGATTAGHYPRNNGTNYVDSAILSGDLPSLSGTYLALSGGGTMNGNILFTDNLYNIGAPSATRPANGYFANSLNAPTINALTGFTISGAAPSGHFLAGTGTFYADNTRLIDDGTTLNYSGTGGISTSALSITTPFVIQTSLPGSPLTPVTGNSEFGVSSDGNWYVSNNGGAMAKLVDTGSLGTDIGANVNANQLGAPLSCKDTSGSGSVQVCTTSPSFTPVTGSCVRYSTTTSNTGASLTLNVNSLGAKPVAKWQNTTSLSAGDVIANKWTSACYDGTNWEIATIGNAPAGGGGGVSSFSGDGTLITNSASTGAVTATLANAGAHKYFGNNSGVSAAPGYDSIVNADLPGTGATTVNGQTCTLGSSCSIESATAGQVAISGGAGAALTGASDLTYSTHTFSMASTGIFDLSASTQPNGFITPKNSGNTASVAGAIVYDNGAAANYHAMSGTTESIIPLISTAAPLVNGNVVDAVVASGNMQLHDSGKISANLVSAASPATSANQVAYSTGAFRTLSFATLDNTTTHALFATAGAPAFRALAATDLPAALANSTSVNGTTIPASSTLPVTVASGTSAMLTAAIGSGACATVVTTSATGVATTDVIQYTPNADPTGITGYAVSATGSLYIWAYPTANNVNFKVCNNTAGSLTPGALTLNWKVVR